jgi:predicted ATPase with chaperone activity
MIEIRSAALVAALMVTTAVTPAFAEQTGRSGAAPGMPDTTQQQGQLSDAMVQKVGTALRHMAQIRQGYTQRAQSANSQQQQQELTDQAQKDMAKAISDQGLSIQQYNQVIQMAQTDATLKQRLLSIAQSGG